MMIEWRRVDVGWKEKDCGMMGDTGHLWHGRGGDDGLNVTMGMI